MNVIVRPATESDMDWLVQELRLFSKFFGTKRQLFGDEAYVRETMLKMINDHCVLIADKNEVGPIGFIGGTVSPHSLNPNIIVLCETFWWVMEKYRMSSAGLKLLQAFIQWGKSRAHWIFLYLEHNSPVSGRALLKRGFKPSELSYILECA